MSIKIGFKDFEHNGWERAADKYEYSWSSLTKKFIPSLLHSVQINDRARLLDLACGPGYVSKAAKNLRASPVGVDFSKKMIQIARRRNPGLKFSEGDAESLFFDNSTFDAVTMNFGMLHMADPEKVFHEAKRVLKKEGRFAFSVWAEPEEGTAPKIVEEAINSYADLNKDIPDGPSAFLFCNPDECKKLFIKTGYHPSSFSFETFTVNWKVPTASFLFESELNGGVRTAALLVQQSKNILEKIRKSIEFSFENFRHGDVYLLPFSAHIISAET